MIAAVIQEETTGCGVAACAALAGVSYQQSKAVAHRLGIQATDQALWSEHEQVRRLLAEFAIATAPEPQPFISWEQLPARALLAIKWHLEQGRPFWHWVVFVRDEHDAYVLDSKKALKTHQRRDFGRIRPKWYIKVLD